MNCQQITEGEVVEKYLTGQLEPSERDDFEVHILECRKCLVLLETCEAARSDLAARADTIRQMPAEPVPALKWGWFTTPRIASLAGLAAVLVVGVFVVARKGVIPVHPSGPNQVQSPVGGSPASSNLAEFPEVAALSSDERQKIAAAVKNRRITYPPDIAELAGTRGVLRSESTQSDRFAVLYPVGEVVADPRPLFRWQALPGAAKYSVAVYDAKLNLLEKSPALRGTQWQANRPLSPGQIFRWQVTATASDGKSVIAPGPSNPEAKFRVLEPSKADFLEGFRKAHPEAHVVLGILAAEAGLLEMSENELKQVTNGSRDYELAQRLLQSLGEPGPGAR